MYGSKVGTKRIEASLEIICALMYMWIPTAIFWFLSQGFIWSNGSNVEIGLQGKGRIIYWFHFSIMRLILLQSCAVVLS